MIYMIINRQGHPSIARYLFPGHKHNRYLFDIRKHARNKLGEILAQKLDSILFQELVRTDYESGKNTKK